jgi:hypothetical protein
MNRYQNLNIIESIHKMKIRNKGRYKMIPKRIIFHFGTISVCLLATTISFGVSSGPSEAETHEYKQDMAHIKTVEKSFKAGPVNDLKDYEKFADEIQTKWNRRNKEYYARLMLEVCGPLSSGRFNDERQYDVARRYALSALSEPNEIPLEVELELTGHIMTDTVTPRAPKGQDWAQRRKKDVEIRLHAWKRLIDSIDPNWDPNDLPVSNLVPPLVTGLPSGVAPEAIKDAKLRAEYEAAIEKNRQKAERYSQQYRLRMWLKRFPARAEEYIITAYSKPPFNVEELKQYFEKYSIDEKTRARILDAVTKNMQEQAEKIPK